MMTSKYKEQSGTLLSYKSRTRSAHKPEAKRADRVVGRTKSPPSLGQGPEGLTSAQRLAGSIAGFFSALRPWTLAHPNLRLRPALEYSPCPNSSLHTLASWPSWLPHWCPWLQLQPFRHLLGPACVSLGHGTLFPPENIGQESESLLWSSLAQCWQG
jgi:hypothetical protein